MNQSGIHGSYLEGSVLDQLFGRQWQPAISATQILMDANEQNIPVYTITAENVNTILPILNVSAEVKSDIIHAVNSGQQAIVPEREIEHGNWKGSGYILQDLLTGSGAYLLEGGYNGGGHEICFESVKPPTTPVAALNAATQQKIAEAFNAFYSTWASILDKIISSDFEYPSEDAKKGVMAAARNLAATVTNIVTSVLSTPIGCLRIVTNDIATEEFYMAFEIDEETKAYKDSVTVNFTSEVPDNCHDPIWDFGNGDTTTEPNPTRVYTKTGKYEVTLTATCQVGRSSSDEQVKVDVYVSKVELDVVEANYPVNRIAQNDPRRTGDDETARNKLLVWHNGDNSISFEVVKQDEDSVFWIEIVGNGFDGLNPFQTTNKLNPELPIFEKLTQTSKLFPSFNVVTNNVGSDFIVRYGLDYDKSGSLRRNEIKGEYQIYALTPFEYNKARTLYNYVYLPLALYQLGNALNSRFANGVFPEPDIFGDYRPNQILEKEVESSYKKLTHQCGAYLQPMFPVQDLHERTISRNEKTVIEFSDAVAGRSYPEAKATYSVYFYDTTSNAVDTIMGHKGFAQGLEIFLKTPIIKKQISYQSLDNLYSQFVPDCLISCTWPSCHTCAWQEIHYKIDATKNFYFNLGAFGSVGLGGARINISDVLLMVRKKRGGPSIPQIPWIPGSVQQPPGVPAYVDYFEIGAISITAKIEDPFDYNYFKQGNSSLLGFFKTLLFKMAESSISAGTIQCGFMKHGRFNNGTGQVGEVHAKISGNRYTRFLEPIIISPP